MGMLAAKNARRFGLGGLDKQCQVWYSGLLRHRRFLTFIGKIYLPPLKDCLHRKFLTKNHF